MFEVKYDREGNPIRESKRIQEMESVQPEAAEQETVQQEAAPEPEDPVEEPEQAEEVETPEVRAEVQEAPKHDHQASFRTLREAKLKAEAERDDLMRRISDLEARSKPAQQVAPEDDSDLQLGADDLVEGKHIAKIQKKSQSKMKDLEDRLAKYEQQSSQQQAEAALRQKYPDFDKVVTMDNIAMLNEAYPEVSKSLYTNNDLYTKAVSAYTLIKKFGIFQDSPFNSEKAQVLKNVNKPRPATSLSPQQGERPLERANAFAAGLTDDLKAQLLKEMQSARKEY